VLSAKLFCASGQLLKSVTAIVKDQPPQKCATGGHPEKRVVPVLGHIDAYDQVRIGPAHLLLELTELFIQLFILGSFITYNDNLLVAAKVFLFPLLISS
jgi:hypothetical protein